MSPPAPSHAELLGGRFVVEREVGRGGVGVVYRAFDTFTEQHVALKIIALPGIDSGEEARFRREGQLLASLNHTGIVKVVAFGQLDEGGPPYVAMEWLDGEDVAQRQRRAPLDLGQSLRVGALVADALAFAHQAGIVHRDVKPSNVFLVGSGAGQLQFDAKLVDFGVATADDAKLTRTGAIVGTPAYMAPEQARGDGEVDARADLYALGATLFEMIAGRAPHVGPTPVAILARLVTTPAPRLAEVFVDATPELDELMAQLLSTHPVDRPPNAGFVARELRRIAEELGPVRRSSGGTPASGSRVSGSDVTGGATTTRNTGGTRLVTSILATQVPKGSPRQRLLTYLRAHGADATELGGDAVVAHLGVRRALGDEAARALELGIRIARLNASVGIATGRTRIDRTRPTGEVVDRAAALARDAQRGQVLADTTTSELARGRYELQMRSDGASVVGEPVKNKKDFVGGAPFVGRQAELAQILGAFERCLDDRTPLLVTVSGAPGIGKTRLRREAISRLASHPSGARIVLAQCETFGKSHALGLVADVARGLASVGKGQSLETALRATDVLVAATEVTVTEGARDVIARLMASEAFPELDDARGARDALWIALTEIAVGLARAQGLVVGVEDAQWADPESLAWLDHLLARSAGTPLYVLATTRPQLWREDPNRFSGREHVRVELRPLARKTVRAIARAVLGDRAVGPGGEELAESIAAQAGGSPLFAEELSRIAAQGRDSSSAATIEAAMQVHLDSLDDASRDAVARFSVFGQSGWDGGLLALGVDGAGDKLRGLSAAEVLVEQARSRFKDTREWAFKHALMREVAYTSLGEEVLKQMHARAAPWLASIGEDDAIVARHFQLAGDSASAAGYLEKAARRALAANALAQALQMAEQALAFADDRPTAFARAQLLDEAWGRLDARAAERETAVRALEENVHDAASAVRAAGARVRYEDAGGGGPDTTARLAQVCLEAQGAGLADEEARCAAVLASRHAFAGELDAAASVAGDLLALSRKHAIPAAAVDAWQTLAVVRQARGEVGAALEARRAAAHAAHEAGLLTREATLTINVGFALTTLGAQREAREAIDSGIALAQAIGSPGTERHGKMILLCWAATFGTDAAADVLLSEPRAMADAAVAGSWVPHDRATLGVLFYRGVELVRAAAGGSADAAQKARTLLKTAAQGYRATKMLDVVPAALGMWAEAEWRAGESPRACELAREAASLLADGSPSLLNEAQVFVALHDACLEAQLPDEARDAIARGVPLLVRRVEGLSGTPYARSFLTLAPNAALVAAAEHYGVGLDEIRGLGRIPSRAEALA